MTKKKQKKLLLLLLLIGISLILYQPLSEMFGNGSAVKVTREALPAFKKGKSPPKGSNKLVKSTRAVVTIPSISLNQPIYDESWGLQHGAYSELSSIKRSLPADPNYVLSGHSSYLPNAWFSALFNLRATQGYVKRFSQAPYRPNDYKGGHGNGGFIVIYNEYGEFTYQADVVYTVMGSDNTILQDPPKGYRKQIHLFTCPRVGYLHPNFRYVVQGSLVKVKLTQKGVDTKYSSNLFVE